MSSLEKTVKLPIQRATAGLSQAEAEALIDQMISHVRDLCVEHHIPVAISARYAEFTSLTGFRHRCIAFADPRDFRELLASFAVLAKGMDGARGRYGI